MHPFSQADNRRTGNFCPGRRDAGSQFHSHPGKTTTTTLALDLLVAFVLPIWENTRESENGIDEGQGLGRTGMTRTRRREEQWPEERPLPDPKKKKQHLERSKRQKKSLKGLLEKEQEIIENKEHIAEKTKSRIREKLKRPLLLDEDE